MKLVVITGCLGFIGSHVTRKCLENGWRVYGIDKCTYAANLDFLKEMDDEENFHFSKEDICDLTHLPDCDYIINLAAETHVGNSIIDSGCFLKSNIDGVKNILDLIREKPKNVCTPPVLLHFSTDEVYGDITEGAHTEDSPLKPSNPYSASKAASDMLIEAWSRTYGLEYVLLRPTNNYGPRQNAEKLIPLSVKLLGRGRKVRLHDGGEPYRNWLHAEDTAEAVLVIMESGETNKIFNIAGGFEQKNKDTVRKIIKCLLPKNVSWENYVDLTYIRPGQDVRYSLDDSRLRKLGWKPEKKFDDEIASIVHYYKTHFRW